MEEKNEATFIKKPHKGLGERAQSRKQALRTKIDLQNPH